MASKIRKFLDIQGLLKLIRLVKNNEQPHWIGTQAEYEAQKANIPNGAIVALTDEEDTTYDHGKFSLVETVTGQRWIDGKPIYRKVFQFTTPAGQGRQQVNFSTGVANIDTVIKQEGAIHTAAGSSRYWMPLQWAYNSGSTGSTAVTNPYLNSSYYSASNNTIYIVTSREAENGRDGFIILEYTKTTD